jgi:hypothetical protein
MIIEGEFYYNTPTFDFGNARNYAKNLALPFGGWVLSLDDDDDIDIGFGTVENAMANLLENLADSEFDAHYIDYEITIGTISKFNSPACRIFKNTPAICWRDNIHESIEASLTLHGLKISDPKKTIIKLIHTGYSDLNVLQKKAKRNIECYLNNPYLLDRYDHLSKFVDTTKRLKDIQNQNNYMGLSRVNVELDDHIAKILKANNDE